MTFEKDTIGIAGFGFVGEAIYEGMKHVLNVYVHDPYKFPNTVDRDDFIVHSMDELAGKCEIIFVCVPTPMNPDGSCSTKIVESVVAQIAESRCGNVVVIKSTVPPGTTDRLDKRFRGLFLKGVVFNPEFLTEATYIDDFKNQTRIIIGGSSDEVKSIVKNLYSKAFPRVPTIKTHPTIAEMVKYVTNSFLAIKVAFANEMHQVCEELGIDYDKVIEYARYDDRLGGSHWSVPGPDGDYGFGLSCLPKDLNALISVARDLGVDPKVMDAVWAKNLEVRQNRDWEKMAKAVVNVKQDPPKSIE